MKSVNIIGMGLSPEDLTVKHLRIIEGADILVGGRRHLEYFKEDHPGEKRVIDRDIEGLIRFIKDRRTDASIVVLASGDPLFFGIGPRLIKALGPENVVVHPNISTVAAAFSRLKEPWQEVRVVSLHGRSGEKELLDALEGPNAAAVYTDPKKNPAWLARLLLKNGMADVNMCILERLGTPDESMEWHTPEQAADGKFSDPNLVVLKPAASPPGVPRPLYPGMPDEEFEHEKGLITKSEVRAVTLSKLSLSAGCTFWDLGAGSGSVSIEAGIYVTRGRIFAVEQNPARI
ncbi:MAG: precorrin-6y C5,15-methyltransferase (decarboxylating) subunit CbiE, partial [Desulfobacterales bacterium]|nr:precorrin-6y C5,15-methyltransferase (decarboxylating) subunit CbiE [Desulfobacterales bacterium]